MIINEVLPYSAEFGFRHNRALAAKSSNYLTVLLDTEYTSYLREEILQELENKGFSVGKTIHVEITGATRVALIGKII